MKRKRRESACPGGPNPPSANPGAAQLAELIEEAQQASQRAYCPYSKFPVGAALLGKSGRIFSGCNVENVSYGLTICAERTAIFKAVSEGEREFDTIVIYTPTDTLTGPCGACRQVMAEFAPQMMVVMVNRIGRVKSVPLSKLLPEMHRVLNPGGSLAVWTAVPGWSPRSVELSGLFSYVGKINTVHNFQSV